MGLTLSGRKPIYPTPARGGRARVRAQLVDVKFWLLHNQMTGAHLLLELREEHPGKLPLQRSVFA
jgi:hypothetical protein